VHTINRTDFIFSRKYRLQRHLLYWTVHIILWGCFWAIWLYWTGSKANFPHNIFKMVIWTPGFILFSFPVAYVFIPRLLMNGKYLPFIAIVAAWGLGGIYFNSLYREFVFTPVQEFFRFEEIYKATKNVGSYLCMTTTTAEFSMLVLLKHWAVKQQEWRQAEQEKISAQLELLKAQLHPHFLFNTLNNIYGFALGQSPKTPQLILKLSSLLSYMLYECRTDQVLLEKEVEIMKNYIDLERERYGEKIDISVNIEGAIRDRFIAPLLLLPFLENAFKHGTSEQIERPWMSVDIAVKHDVLKCKVINSKNEIVPFRENGVGVSNIRKRLKLLYPEKHELKLVDEGAFFVVALSLELPAPAAAAKEIKMVKQQDQNLPYEIALSAH